MRDEVLSALEIVGLIGFAVVQPVLGPYGESPETFVSVGASPGDIVTFALVVALVPIVVVVALAVATRSLGERIRGIVQSLLVAGLAGAAATALVRHLGAGGVARTLAAVTVAALVAVAHRRWAPARSFLRFTSPTPLLLVAAFLLASPVAPLVRPASTTATDGHEVASDLPPVLMIVLDELPTTSLMDGQGGLDRELFPNLARLADSSTWYRNHTVGATRTAVSLPTLVTGRFPTSGPQRPAVHGEYPESLFTLLGATHDVHAVEWVTDLCPPSLCDGDVPPIDDTAASLLDGPLTERGAALPQLTGEALDLWWGQVWPTAVPPDAEYAVAGAEDPDQLARPGLEFVSGLGAAGDRPTFDYLHAPLPHQPWSLLPSGASYEGPHPVDGASFGGWGYDELGTDFAHMARVRHVLQLQWADRLLGTIIDRMEELGRWDDAVVVLTADHGISFEPGQPLRALEPGNAVDIAWAPLFVKAPGQTEAAIVDDNVLAVDIVPTVADLVGIEPGWEVDGISLAGPPRTTTAKPVATPTPEAFGGRTDQPMVDVDHDDALATVLVAGDAATGPDPVRAWRHGRHGALLGRRVADVGVCAGSGPTVTATPPDTWRAYLDGTLDRAVEPVPLWHDATVSGEERFDVAAAVDGVVVGWSPVFGVTGGLGFGILLAEPLVDGATGDPVYYEVVDDDGCALVPLAT